jgi:hypothetical protein
MDMRRHAFVVEVFFFEVFVQLVPVTPYSS